MEWKLFLDLIISIYLKQEKAIIILLNNVLPQKDKEGKCTDSRMLSCFMFICADSFKCPQQALLYIHK